MIILVTVILLALAAFFAGTLWVHHKAKKAYEKAVTDAYEQARKEKEALQNPERDLSEKEVDDAVSKLRRIGRPPE